MKLEEFINLIKNVKDANNISLSLLELLYNSITKNEINLCDGGETIINIENHPGII